MNDRPLLHFPAARQAPASVLRDLREIDPRAELLHLGGTRWVLGTVRPGDPAAVRFGASQLASVRRWVTRGSMLKVRMAHAHLQGFKPIEEYQVGGEMGFARVVKDFRERDWRYRHRWLEELDAREEETDIDTERRAALTQSITNMEDRARDGYRYAFRAARHFRHPGTAWGRKALVTAK